MNLQAKQRLVNQIVDIIRQVKDHGFANETNRRSKLLGGDGFFFSLVDETADQYDGVVKFLFEGNGWSSKFSEKHIDKALHQILAGAVKNIREGNTEQTADYVGECVDHLVEEFENYSQEQIVYIPLANILMRIDELKVGIITLITMTDTRFGKLSKNIESEMNQLPIAQEEKNRVLQLKIQELHTRIAGKVCAEFHTIAEPDKAMELAVEACRLSLDLLRYSIHMIHRSGAESSRMAVGFPDEVFRADRHIVVIQTISHRFTASSQYRGPLAPFVIDTDIEDRMKKLGAFKVGGIMVKQSTTKFEKALLRGIRSFGKSYTHTEKEDRFLSLIACLENFIKTDLDERVAKTVAESVAFVLGTNPKERRSLRDIIKSAYSTRSSIVHGRQAEVLDADINKLRDIVGDFVACMIQLVDKFKEQKDLVEWIDEQKFGDKTD